MKKIFLFIRILSILISIPGILGGLAFVVPTTFMPNLDLSGTGVSMLLARDISKEVAIAAVMFFSAILGLRTPLLVTLIIYGLMRIQIDIYLIVNHNYEEIISRFLITFVSIIMIYVLWKRK